MTDGPPVADPRPVVLCFVQYYLPGYKAGGPLRSLAHLVQELGLEFRFYVIARDRDLGEDRPYPGLAPEGWSRVPQNQHPAARVRHLAPDECSFRALRATVRSAPEPAVYYLNSVFEPTFTLKPLLLRWARLIPRARVIVAPRGELSPGALAIRRRRKRLFLAVTGHLGFFRGITWQASNPGEAGEIRRWFGTSARIGIAPPLTAPVDAPSGTLATARAPKQPGALDIVFLSRIAPKKNLDGALEWLRDLPGRVRFTICGPIDDRTYWRQCRRLIARLPDSITVECRGPIPPPDVPAVLRAHHLFFLPTHGENFGHVIHEALAAGCPVLISDRTPWRGLETLGVGWDLSLEAPGAFDAALRRCLAMNAAEHAAWSQRAAIYARSRQPDASARAAYRRLLAPPPPRRGREDGGAGDAPLSPRSRARG